MSKYLSTFFLLFACSFSLAAKGALEFSPAYRIFSVQNGLPSSEAYFVFQDSQGYIWMGTDRGVVRFNGYQMKLYTAQNGLCDNVNFICKEDRKGRVFFFGFNGEISVYEKGKMKPYPYNHLIKKMNKTIKSPTITAYFDTQNTLFISFRYSNTYSITEKGVFKNITNNKPGYHLVNDGANLFQWHVTPLSHLLTKEQEKIPFEYVLKGTKIRLDPIFPLHDFRGVVYKDAGFFIENRKLYGVLNNKVVLFPNYGTAISIFADKSYLYVGYFKGGVRKFKLDTKKVSLVQVDHLLKKISISSTCIDFEGGEWFSTLEKGVFYNRNSAYQFLTDQDGLIENDVQSINGINDKVLVGFFGGKWQEITPPFRKIESLDLDIISSCIMRFNNQLYIQSKSRLQNPIEYVNSDYYFYSAFANKRHMYFFSPRLNCIDDKGNKEVVPYLPYWGSSKFDYRLYKSEFIVSATGDVYVGNISGLVKIRNQQIVPFLSRDPLFSVRVDALVDSPKHGLVCGTRGEGVYFLKNDKIVGRLTTKNGLMGDQINEMYLDEKNRIWIATNEGLELVEGELGHYKVTHFNTKNGLITNEIEGIYVVGNKVWLATKEGVAIIELDKVIQQTPKFEIFLEDVVCIGNSKGESKIKTEFENGLEAIEISFRTTNYQSAKNHRFRYRLSKNQSWINLPTNEVIINNPSFGSYDLEVSYLNDDNQWVSGKSLFKFYVLPPIWIKWYMILLYVFAFFGILYGAFYLRIKQVERKNNYMNQINFLEQQALAAQMSPHFIFNSLNSIQSFLLFQENEKAEKYLLKFSKLIRQNLTNSRERYVRLTEEIDMLRNYIELEKMRFKNSFDVQIEVQVEMRLLNYFIPPMLIQPYVENAIIHGLQTRETGGVLMLIFTVSENVLTVFVEDNGVGIGQTKTTKLKQHRSYGTQITEERMRVFQNKFKKQFIVEVSDLFYEETEFPGTRVMLTIPLISADESEENSYH